MANENGIGADEDNEITIARILESIMDNNDNDPRSTTEGEATASQYSSIGLTKLEIMGKSYLPFKLATKCLESLERDGLVDLVPGNRKYSVTKEGKIWLGKYKNKASNALTMIFVALFLICISSDFYPVIIHPI